LIDLFVVSVLLDAGAGDKWKYEEPGSSGQVYTRSEGIAVASLYMFLEGKFSTTEGVAHMVDGECCCEEDEEEKLILLQQRDFNVSMKRHSPKASRSLLRTQ
jgi:hypothetical protein